MSLLHSLLIMLTCWCIAQNVNAKGEPVYVKYHFKTDQGIRNLPADKVIIPQCATQEKTSSRAGILLCFAALLFTSCMVLQAVVTL
jgi:Catalase